MQAAIEFSTFADAAATPLRVNPSWSSIVPPVAAAPLAFVEDVSSLDPPQPASSGRQAIAATMQRRLGGWL
jgi:hypothetical protein